MLVLVIIAFLGFVISLIIRKNKKRKEELLIKKIEEENRKIENLKFGLPIIDKPSLLLGSDKLHYYEPATLLVTKNKVVGYTGGGGGVSVRIAKGIYLRSGSGRRQPIHRDVTSQYYGNLAVTNDRIIFINSQKGFDIKIKNISVIEPYSDGVVIQAKNKSYALLLDTPRYFCELLNIIMAQ